MVIKATIIKVLFAETYVNVIFVIRCLYSAVSLTQVKERRLIRIIIIIPKGPLGVAGVLSKFWAALCRRRTINRDEQWRQQGGSTCHTSSNALLWLRQRFENRLISRRYDIEWALHSQDLNHQELCLWGFLKDKVYVNNPETVDELKTAITARIRARVTAHAACKSACNVKGVIWNT